MVKKQSMEVDTMKNYIKKFWVVLIAVLFVLTPYALDLTSGGMITAAALAKSGNGGGHGSGHGSGSGNSAPDASAGNSHAHSNGLGLGLDKQGYGKGFSGKTQTQGSISSKLGRLNAAHASATARANAAPHSAVGRIAAYEVAVYERQNAQMQLEALQEVTTATPEEIAAAQAVVDEAAQFEMETLSAAANKNIDEEVVQAINELLGIEEPEESAGI